jgi:hypothetical protein
MFDAQAIFQSSSPRKREPSAFAPHIAQHPRGRTIKRTQSRWVPAFAGMTSVEFGACFGVDARATP